MILKSIFFGIILLLVLFENSCTFARPEEDFSFETIRNIFMPLKELGGHKYYLSLSMTANWFKALQFCHTNGMQLVSIKSKEKSDNIAKLLEEHGEGYDRFWTAGNDLAEEGKFYWMDSGEPFTFTNWQQGEPTNIVEGVTELEHCVELWKISDSKYEWNDLRCSREIPFICEKIGK